MMRGEPSSWVSTTTKKCVSHVTEEEEKEKGV